MAVPRRPLFFREVESAHAVSPPRDTVAQADRGRYVAVPAGRGLYLTREAHLPLRVSRRDVLTGVTSPWLEIQPADMTGVDKIVGLGLNPDGSYGYTDSRTEASDLFVIDGLK